MHSRARIFFLLLPLCLLISSCATASRPPATESGAAAEELLPPDLPKADFDPELNRLVHQGWSVSIPPGWSAEADRSGDDAFIFRTGTDDGVLTLQRLNFNFQVERQKLIAYIEERLKSQGDISERQTLEISNPGRQARLRFWRIERPAGGPYWVALEENSQGLFEWTYMGYKQTHPVYDEVMQRIFREAGMTSDRSISRRKRDTGYMFGSQGGPWRWAGDVGDGIYLECLHPEGEPYTAMIFLRPSEKERLASWEKEYAEESSSQETLELRFAGQPVPTALLLDKSSEMLKSALFHYGEDTPVTIFLYMRSDDIRDEQLDDFLRGDELKRLLNLDLVLPGRS